MADTTEHLLSDEVRREIDRWVLRYPPDQRQSGILQALTIVQDENDGSLTDMLIDAVADHLNMPRIAAHEVATFYTMFNRAPVGRYVVDVCTNVSCMLSNSEYIVECFEKELGIKIGETTADRRFTLRAVECLAACTKAPACQINKKFYENLTAEKVKKILDSLE